MGALTNKNFPFELRGWDLEKFDGFDLTDGFGSNVRIYINKNHIVLIEPDCSTNTFNTWLTDKGRQFFDGIFNSFRTNSNKNLNIIFWSNFVYTVNKAVYFLDVCNKLNVIKNFVTIVYENLSLEGLNILALLSQNYAFINLRRAEKLSLKNDLEYNFQLNAAADDLKLSFSNTCILVSSNTRYEGSCLNLNLRQRFLKGNFRCLILGSLINLTFPNSFLGSSVDTVKPTTEGNTLICRDLKSAQYPFIVYNNDLLRRADGNTLVYMLKVLTASVMVKHSWCGVNTLNYSLSETGNHLSIKTPSLTLKDLKSVGFLYFINVTTNHSANFRLITKLNLLKYHTHKQKRVFNNLIVEQNYKKNNTSLHTSLNLNKVLGESMYIHVPASIFYENNETFVSTEGFFKRTLKIISRKKTRANWLILRKLLRNLKKKIISLDEKNNELIFFNSNKNINFKNFMLFQYNAARNLTNLSYLLSLKTVPTVFNAIITNYKITLKKIQSTKFKYWLDDFYLNGKDGYSQNSLTLAKCSLIIRSETTNFF